MRVEHLDRRILGAVRFVDAATGLRVRGGLRVRAEGVRWIRNRQGIWIILEAPGLEDHAGAFLEPPPVPAPGSVGVEMRVEDPRGRYLARLATVALPRTPDPDAADQPDSLFVPVDVALYPSPSARPAPGWALVRARVATGDRGIGGALLRVVGGEGEVLARGVTDHRGEALVAVPGIPVTTWEREAEDGPVIATEVQVELEAIVDPDLAPVNDPDDLEARRDELESRTETVRLAAGRKLSVEL